MISESGEYILLGCPDAVGGTRSPLAVCGSLEPQLTLETSEQGTDSQGTVGGQSPLCFLLVSNLITRCPPSPLGLQSLPLLSSFVALWNSPVVTRNYLWQEILMTEPIWSTRLRAYLPDFHLYRFVHSACLTWHLMWISALWFQKQSWEFIWIKRGSTFISSPINYIWKECYCQEGIETNGTSW